MSLNEVIGLMSTILITLIGLMTSIVALGPAMTAGLVPFMGVVAGISGLLTVMSLTLPIILDAVGNFINATAPVLIELLIVIGNNITKLIFALGTTLPPIINSVGTLFNTIFNGISKVVNSVGNVIIRILDTAGALVSSVLGSILSFIERLGPAINIFVDNAIQAVTKLINFMISGIEYLVNTLIIGGVNKIIDGINSISKYVGFTISNVPDLQLPRFMPQLATGAVIPPRQEFAAILGDQKHGTNIEAPLETIKQANREVLTEFFDKMQNLSSDIKEIIFKNFTIVAQFGNRDFQKLVIDAVRLTEQEIGRPLFVS